MSDRTAKAVARQWRVPARVVGAVGLSTLMCVLAAVSTLSAQDTVRGKLVYDKWCAECHGWEGAGDGSAAAFMLPRPRDFTLALYQIRTTASGELPTDADIRRVVDEGMPGTAMPGWQGRLSDRERRDVVAYLKTFSRFFEDAAPGPLAVGKAPGRSDEGIREGRRVYEQLECFKCHGDQGRGDGTSAPTVTDDWDQPIRVANLQQPWRFNGGSTVEQIYYRMRTGLDGTPMPSFSDVIDAGVITDEQLWRVAQYVRSLGPERSPPRVREVVRAVLIEGEVPAGPDDSVWVGVERFYVPLAGQIIVKPRWFAPLVEGVWVQAVHNGEHLALRLAWGDPSASPDPSWQEWVDRVAAAMTDADGPVPAQQGPDRLHVQFPLRLSDGMERPYFLGGDTRRPVYMWRWSSAPDRLEEGTARGLDRFVAAGGAPQTTHAARFEHGQWQLQITRALETPDTASALTFVPGRAIPMAFFAADGSNGELGLRGAVSAWYAVYLDVPTPAAAFVTPLVAMLLTAGFGVMVVWRAQRRDRPVARHLSEES